MVIGWVDVQPTGRHRLPLASSWCQLARQPAPSCPCCCAPLRLVADVNVDQGDGAVAAADGLHLGEACAAGDLALMAHPRAAALVLVGAGAGGLGQHQLGGVAQDLWVGRSGGLAPNGLSVVQVSSGEAQHSEAQ